MYDIVSLITLSLSHDLREVTAALDSHSPVSGHVRGIYQKNLTTLRAQKAVKVEPLITSQREIISSLCDQLLITSSQAKQSFPEGNEQVFTEKRLELHRRHVSKLRERLEIAEPVLTLQERRQRYKQQLIEFEFSVLDPGRYIYTYIYMCK